MPTPIPTGITLETVVYKGSSRSKKNLLFLGDGFSAADRGLFDRTIDEIIARFFRKAPFNIRGMKNEFNFFKAFTPGVVSGISCELEIDANGIPLDSGNSGTAGPSIGKLEEIQSALGLTYATRARAISAKTGDKNLIRDFIATLSLPVEGASSSAIPDCWATPPSGVSNDVGKDFGLVVVLVNDDKRAGSYTPGQPYTPITIGVENRFNLTASTTAPNVHKHQPASPRNNYNLIAIRILHELGHSYFNLGDEYSYKHNPLVATTKNYFAWQNLVTKEDVLDNGSPRKFDPARIKWNKEVYSGSTQKIISSVVSDYIKNNNKALWERPSGAVCANIGHDGNVKYPPQAVRAGIRYPQRIIGLYEGGKEHCGAYSPAGSCRMKSTHWDTDFCYVCKYAIVEKINPNYLERLFNAFYPR